MKDLKVKAGSVSPKPLEVNENFRLEVGERAQLTLVERVGFERQGEISLGEGASLIHIMLDGEKGLSGRLSVSQSSQSQYASYLVGEKGKHEARVLMEGPHASCSLSGLLFVGDENTFECTTLVDNVSPHCKSEQLFKAVVGGKGKGIFEGKVIVREGAQKTDASQTNRNLLLSRDAEVFSRPHLEILADDVKCSHGSTTGELDEVALYYLRTRGISEGDARRLLVRAFAAEITSRIPIEALRRELEGRLLG